MGEQTIVAMTADEFFAWQERQSDLYELVDGYPLRMMSGASNRHDQITVNIIAGTATRLRGNSCRPTTQDTSIRISNTQIRRPDVAIACGPIVDNSYIATDPRVVFEVLSPSTRLFDQAKKLEEYKSVASLRRVLLIDPDAAEVIVFTREANAGWTSRTITGLDQDIVFADPELVLPMAEIYAGLTFRPRPILVEKS